MAISFVIAPGQEDSTSYCSVAYADDYHDARLHSSEWVETASDPVEPSTLSDKEKALLWATRLLDSQVMWTGIRGSYEQSLDWPRENAYDVDDMWYSNLEIPIPVQNATAELAWLLVKEDRTIARSDAATAGLKSVVVGPLRLNIDPEDRKITIPESVISLLRGLGRLSPAALSDPGRGIGSVTRINRV